MRGHTSEDAVVQAIDTSGRAVLFAGIIVCIALLGMIALGVGILSGVGIGIAASLVVGFTVFAALTLLPALLGFFGTRAQIAIRRRGTLLWAACAGRVDRTEPVAPEDRFVLASTTKLATACLVALLAERGVLALDDPVRTWLPELPHADRLTPRLLLAHRSGLREYGRDRTLARRLTGGAPHHPWTRDEVIAAIARLGPEREPDRRFAYRNSNYVVAAELAERAGGDDFATLRWRPASPGRWGSPGSAALDRCAAPAWRHRTWPCSDARSTSSP